MTLAEAVRENRRLRAALAAADATIKEMQAAFVEMAAVRAQERAEDIARIWAATSGQAAMWRPWHRWEQPWI